MILNGAFETIRERCMKKLKMQGQLSDTAYRDNEYPQLESLMYEEMRKSTRHLQTLLR